MRRSFYIPVWVTPGSRSSNIVSASKSVNHRSVPAIQEMVQIWKTVIQKCKEWFLWSTNEPDNHLFRSQSLNFWKNYSLSQFQNSKGAERVYIDCETTCYMKQRNLSNQPGHRRQSSLPIKRCSAFRAYSIIKCRKDNLTLLSILRSTVAFHREIHQLLWPASSLNNIC